LADGALRRRVPDPEPCDEVKYPACPRSGPKKVPASYLHRAARPHAGPWSGPMHAPLLAPAWDMPRASHSERASGRRCTLGQ